jgi:formylglycine-generating enzyme required for sulfatase activity
MSELSSTSLVQNKTRIGMKKHQHTSWILKSIVFVLAALATAKGADSDFDGLDDTVETNTGIYVSPSNTGTNPSAADSDGDGVPDGLEVKEKTSPVDATKFNSFSKGLAGYWEFDASYADTSGNQIDFVTTPYCDFSVGRNNNSNESLRFTNVAGRATSAKPIEISGNQDRTISYWCKLPQSGLSVSVGWGSNQGSPSAPGTASCLVANSEGRVFHWGAYADIESNVRITPKIWNHVVISYKNNFSEAKIAINGKVYSHFNGSLNTLNQLNTSNTAIKISGYTFGDISNQSMIDSVRIYRRALTDIEINQLYKYEAPKLQIIDGTFAWSAAKANAEARGGRLAVLNTPEKIAAANTLISSQVTWPSLWIGAEKLSNSTQWSWINGSLLNANNWGVGEPNGSSSLSLNAMIWSSADAQPLKWSDDRGDVLNLGYLLEKLYKLTASTVTNGNLAGVGEYPENENVLLTATPLPGYVFSSWTGSASGTTNPLTIAMDADKTVGATFVPDLSDADGDGITAYDEATIYGSNPDLADTDGDGINDGAEVTQGRSPKTAEPVITNITATQRSGTKFVDINYDLASLTPTVKVTLEISSDGGITYNVPVASTTGAVGNGVTVGSGKTIVWNAGADWDGNFSNQMRFRLAADDLQVPGFSLIPAGAFTMGRTSGDTDADAPPVNVTLSQFYMGKYEVTKAEWDEVRAWAVNNGYTDLATGAGKASNHPVQTVSWWDVIKWCNARSQKEGLTPCYTISGSVMKTGTTAPTVNWTANGYRLPTEAEWEKAARGGVNGKRFPWGTDTISHNEANFYNNGTEAYKTGTSGYHPVYAIGVQPYTSPVGSFVANGYELHDMAGNVWEWCWDWYGASTYVNNATDPRGAASGADRVLRGGAWLYGAVRCRAAYRVNFTPSGEYNDFGFRVARSNSITLGVSNSSSAQNTTVDIRNFSLSKTTTTNGSISGNASYLSGSSATVTATPQPGYLFGLWTGDASGSTNPTTILMDSNKTVGATFIEDTRDPDNDGLSNYQEIIVQFTNPDLADTDGDGLNDGVEVAQGRSPKTAEPVITNITAAQRSGTKIVDISYDLASVTPTVKVTMEISSDGGLTYNVPVTSTTGAIGNGVTIGTGKTIAWNAGADWDGNFSNQMRFRLIADDLQVPGFSLIPAGAFTMGRTSGDTDTNAPTVNVTVSQFYMGKYEVTKAEWDEVRAWAVNNGYTDLATGAGKANNHPVQTVSWWDVIKWCNARSQKEGLTPCYTVSGSVMKTGTTEPTVNWTANGYRLPSEAEWEKSARGGVSGKRFPWGTDTISHSEANFNNSESETYKSGTTGYHPTYATGSTPYTSPVGSFSANGFGLHDLAGNVWELCWDWHGAFTYVNNATDPLGAVSSSVRVVRGGSWIGSAFDCRASHRNSVTPSYSSHDVGFRLARSNSVTLGVSNSTSPQNTTVDIRNFSLSKTNTTNGSISGTASYLSGSSATVTATPQPGYLFGSWTGDASGSANPTIILMDSDKTVGATFVEDARDPDNDGLTNYQEIIVRLTNPDMADTDSDGVNDGQEVTDATNPLVADTDGDGLSDGEERTLTTDPLVADTDGDTYYDGYEVQFTTDPKLATSIPIFLLTLSNNGSALGGSFAMSGSLAHGTNASVTATPLPGYLFGSWTGNASGSANPTTVLMDANKTVGATFVEDSRDPDNDGLTNYQEIIIRITNPDLADSDSDGVNDGQEVTDTTNPLVADTDGDGLTDGEEKTRTTNPLVTDTDADGVNDAQEVTDATHPLIADSDGDGLTDGDEKTRTTNPLSQDSDGDGVSDAQEVTDATNPLLADTDGDGVSDGQEKTRTTNPLVTDSDSDGVNDGQEVIDTTNPLVADTDADGLTDGEEKTKATNPLVVDSDGDGLTDGEEKTRNTNPLAKDTDGDGLSDLEEELNTKTNPLLADTDGDSISDALEDTDNDGISNLREVTELKTDPLLADTDKDGLSDTYELVYKGTVEAYAPRIGDRLRFELRELVPQGTLKLVGTLPTGLSFNAVTGVLEGKLTGKPGSVKLTIQVLNGKTVLRTIPFQFTIAAFPSGLIGSWQVLLEDANGSPQGLITTTVKSPGTWSATYDGIATSTTRSGSGVFDLTPSMNRAAFAVTFPASYNVVSFSTSLQIDAITALAGGTYAQGTMRGFRLAKTGELPTAARQVTMVIDQGEQDGYQVPAGLGWATGTLSTSGSLPLSGQLGDAQTFRKTVNLGATGQAILWVKPYRNLNSTMGGIISLRDTGVVPPTSYAPIQNGLLWQRVADSAELSYGSGFGPLAADASVNPYLKPASAVALATNLGLTNNQFRNVTFDGGGLPNAEQTAAMPERFVMDSSYKLAPVAVPGRVMALWQGGISSSAGTFKGTIALDASNSGILKGNAGVSGVVFRRNDLESVGAGLIKIPTTGVKGSFRTGAFLMDR